MTIKEFAVLCGCNPQTLRYYDHEDLLKPMKVDQWSGYRFYEEEQALVYVKIKNLQKAGFTISEVKDLLNQDDHAIYSAFEAKIAKEEEKIMELREIQKSYQSEIDNMDNKIETLRKLLLEAKASYNPEEEFGLSKEEYDVLMDQCDSLLREIKEDDVEFWGFAEEESDAEEEYFEGVLNNPKFQIVFERHGWRYVKDFFSEIPVLEEQNSYLFFFRLNASKPGKTVFANTILAMCSDRIACSMKLGCSVIDSKDYDNHFWLISYKDLENGVSSEN